jgi:hypothetical protein
MKKYVNDLTEQIPVCLIRENNLFLFCNYPVTAQSKALKHWDFGFESFSRRGCMSKLFCVALFYVGTGLAMASFKSLTNRI